MPLRSAASHISRAWAELNASGFSQKTCLPALAAATAISWCMFVGAAISTMSMSGRLTTSRQSVVHCSQPHFSANSSSGFSGIPQISFRTG